ncbi:MAG: aminomethyltransferase, partial [Gammaproteobacteria bacterium]|nr:aminomethyltransferase [Gammaproteobacteria bacterium]
MMASVVYDNAPGTRPRLIEPSLWRRQPGRERYRVPGAGAIVVGLQPGDELKVCDPEGGQRCELVAFDSEGRCDAHALGIDADADATGLHTILAADSESAKSVRASVERRGIKLAEARALPLFGSDSSPGAAATFTAQQASTCIICAPGESMQVDAQNPPTDLT